MYSTCLFGGHRTRHQRAGLLAWAIIFMGMTSAAQYATAADAVSPATMQYRAGTAFPAAAVNFDLLAIDSGLGDDCDTLASTSASASSDTLLLAKLETDQKTPAPIRPSKSKAVSSAAPVVSTTAVSAPIAVDAKPIDPVWEIIVSDKTLNAAMARWAAQAGWQLLWELPVDYAVEARTTVHGTFEEAVNTVAKSMEGAEIPMKAVFYQGNKVLRIMSKGGE